MYLCTICGHTLGQQHFLVGGLLSLPRSGGFDKHQQGGEIENYISSDFPFELLLCLA